MDIVNWQPRKVVMARLSMCLRNATKAKSPFRSPLEATMKRVLISAALLALMACTASAAGLNLAWSECVGGGGPSNDAFACNNNTASHILVGSYFPPAGMTAVNSNEIVVDLQTNQAVLSPWWTMGTTGCPGRTGTPTGNFDFTAGPFGCFDYWAGNASGGANYYPGVGGPNRARILLVCAISEALAGPLDPNVETYSFKCSISSARTVGTLACPGCTDAACIVLNNIKVIQNPGLPARDVSNPAVTNIARWRGGLTDCSVTPAKNTTWGSVKALYR